METNITLWIELAKVLLPAIGALILLLQLLAGTPLRNAQEVHALREAVASSSSAESDPSGHLLQAILYARLCRAYFPDKLTLGFLGLSYGVLLWVAPLIAVFDPAPTGAHDFTAFAISLMVGWMLMMMSLGALFQYRYWQVSDVRRRLITVIGDHLERYLAETARVEATVKEGSRVRRAILGWFRGAARRRAGLLSPTESEAFMADRRRQPTLLAEEVGSQPPSAPPEGGHPEKNRRRS